MHLDLDPPHLSLLTWYYTYLYLFHAGIDKERYETKIRKVLLSMQEHLA